MRAQKDPVNLAEQERLGVAKSQADLKMTLQQKEDTAMPWMICC